MKEQSLKRIDIMEAKRIPHYKQFLLLVQCCYQTSDPDTSVILVLSVELQYQFILINFENAPVTFLFSVIE